jgi:hypothetical protein
LTILSNKITIHRYFDQLGVNPMVIFYTFLSIIFQASVCWAGISIPEEMTHEAWCSPGEEYKKLIPLSNTGNDSLQVKISHVDYICNAKGENFFEKIPFHTRSNGSWTKIFPSYIELPPQKTTYINCAVAVPSDPLLQGTYWSMLLIEPVEKRFLPVAKDREALGIQTIVRYGLLLVTHVGKEGKKQLKIIDKGLKEKTFWFDYENHGDWLLKPKIAFKIFDLQGVEVKEYVMGLKKLYPGCSAHHEVNLSELPDGKYKGLLLFDQEDSLFGAEYQFSIGSR